MLINLRGGLGNQIIQIGFILGLDKAPSVNTNATKLRKELNNIHNVSYINNNFINLFFGSLRKIYTLIRGKPTDISCCGIKDGYFQYGDITNILSLEFKSYLEKQVYKDENIQNSIDIVFHVRGGDYFTVNAKKIYDVCDRDYYRNALEIALKEIDKKKCNIYIVTNDKHYSHNLLNGIIDCKHNVFEYYESEWHDFSLICNAKIAIIPNSTFSMVARMILDDNKITIAPKNWFTVKSNLVAPYNNKFIYL